MGAYSRKKSGDGDYAVAAKGDRLLALTGAGSVRQGMAVAGLFAVEFEASERYLKGSRAWQRPCLRMFPVEAP
jgi:hypothetical protein